MKTSVKRQRRPAWESVTQSITLLYVSPSSIILGYVSTTFASLLNVEKFLVSRSAALTDDRVYIKSETTSYPARNQRDDAQVYVITHQNTKIKHP